MTKKKAFSAWQKRDLGSTYANFGVSVDPILSDLTMEYDDETLLLSWESVSSPWRYEIFCTEMDKTPTFPNLLGYAYENRFQFEPQYQGDFDLYVIPEDDEGNYWMPLKARVHLQ